MRGMYIRRERSSSIDGLSPENLADFNVRMAGLPPEEIQKAKRLHLLNAIGDFELMQSNLALAFMGLFFAAFPCVGWIFLLILWSGMINGRKAAQQRISNALEVWRDDLGEEYFDLRDRLAAASATPWVVFLVPLLGLSIGVLAPALFCFGSVMFSQ
jgi:hypothetical protein